MRAYNIFFILAQLIVGSSHFGFDDAISKEKGYIPFDNEKNDVMFYSNRFGVPPVGGTNIEDFDTMKDVKNIEAGLPSKPNIEHSKLAKLGNNETIANDTETNNFINIPAKHYNMAGHLLKYGGIRIFAKNDKDSLFDLKLADGNLNMTKTLSNGTKLMSEVKNVDKDNIAIIINKILTSETISNVDIITSVTNDQIDGETDTSSILKATARENKDKASMDVYTKKSKDHIETLTFETRKMPRNVEGKLTHPEAELDHYKGTGSDRRIEADYTDPKIPSPNEANGVDGRGLVGPDGVMAEEYRFADELDPDVKQGLGGGKVVNQVPIEYGQPLEVDGMGEPTGELTRPTGEAEMHQFGARQVVDYDGIQDGMGLSEASLRQRHFDKMQDMDPGDYGQNAIEEKLDNSNIDIDQAPKLPHETNLSEKDQLIQAHPTKSLVFENQSVTDINFRIIEYDENIFDAGKLAPVEHTQRRHSYLNNPGAMAQDFSPSDTVHLNMQRESDNKLIGIKPVVPSENYLDTVWDDTLPTYQQYISPNRQYHPPGMQYYNSQLSSNQNKNLQGPLYPLKHPNSLPNIPGAISKLPSPMPNYPAVMTNVPSAMPYFPGAMTHFPSPMPYYPGALTNFPSAMPNYPGARSNFPSTNPNFPQVMYNVPVTQHAIVRRTNDLISHFYSDGLTFAPFVDSITSATTEYTPKKSTTAESVTPKIDKLRYLAHTVKPVTNNVIIKSNSTSMAATSLSDIDFQSTIEKFAPPPFRSDNYHTRYPRIVNQNLTYFVTDSNYSPSEVTRKVTVITTPNKQVALNTSALIFVSNEYRWYDNATLRRNTWSSLTTTQKKATISKSTTGNVHLDMRARNEDGESQYKTSSMPLHKTVPKNDSKTNLKSENMTSTQPNNIFVSKMMQLDTGYMTTFASLITEYLAKKNATVITELSRAFAKEWDDLVKAHKEIKLWFGERCFAKIEEFKTMILGEDVLRLMDQTLRANVALTTRNESLSVELNMLLSFIDTLYTPTEGETMAKLANQIREYPNKVCKGYTANYVLKKLLYKVFLYPFTRLASSVNKKLLVDGITMYLDKYYSDRKDFIGELMKGMGRRAGVPHSFIDLMRNGLRKESTTTNDAMEYLPQTGESIQRGYKFLVRDRYRASDKTRQTMNKEALIYDTIQQDIGMHPPHRLPRRKSGKTTCELFTPNDMMDLKKQKMELELKLLQEKVEIAKREKYKLDLELLKMEKEVYWNF